MQAAGDRQDIFAIDGNCKLHRRTCGMPFAEVVPSPHLNKLLLRGCSARPHGRDTLCWKHAQDRDRPQHHRAETIARHRLKKALHADGDVCHFEIQLEGFRGWQPACTIKEEVLAQYLPPKLTRILEESGNVELKPAPKSGQALDHAGPGLSWRHGILLSLDRKAVVGPTRRVAKMPMLPHVLLASFLLSPSPACSWMSWSLLEQNPCRSVFILLLNVPTDCPVSHALFMMTAVT